MSSAGMNAALPPFGFLNIDKPLGHTSHDVVYDLRRAAKRDGWPKLKIGHAGTLDPLATGVLIVCVGGAVRLSEFVMAETKRYTAHVQLGAVSSTYDREGAITVSGDAASVTVEAVHAALTGFTGDRLQLPPMYSAIKSGGRKLYDIARAGGTVELTPRPIRIDALTLIEFAPPLLTLDVVCSAGTYLRSLAHDLGAALGVGALLAGLRRTASGGFRVEAAVNPDVFADVGWVDHVIAPGAALPDWRTLRIDAHQVMALYNGRAIRAALSGLAGERALALDPGGRVVAVLRAVDDLWQPDKVFKGD